MRDAVSPSSWEPQYPLTAAETFVRWELHQSHIVNQRARVEKLALPTVRRLALAVSDFNLPLNRVQQKLEDQLLLGLERSVRFGHREAQREIRTQRGQPSGRRSLPASSLIGEARGLGNDSLPLRPATSLDTHELPDPLRAPLLEEAFSLETAARTLSNTRATIENRRIAGKVVGRPEPATPLGGRRIADGREVAFNSPGDPSTLFARYAIPDVGRYADSARHGLPGIYALIRHRSKQVVRNVSDAAQNATWQSAGEDKVAAGVAVFNAASRALHNSVLELVGEALNLGRTAGALSVRPVPEFALRSAQLDKNSCQECDHLHGEIVQVDTTEYYDVMPPAECLGGGRCRCVYVFQDGIGLTP